MAAPSGVGGLRQALDDALTGYLATQRERMAQLAPSSAALLDLVTQTVATGGKRLRPILCWCAHQVGGGQHGPEILRAAASLELLHTFAILHDDVMDQAVLRRGYPALHRRLAEERRAAGGGEDADTFGISVAVLAGDLALVLSDALFAASGFGAATLARAEGPLEGMRAQAIAGQYLDILEAGTLEPSQRGWGGDAALIGHLKTAGYSVEGPLAVGAALAGATGEIAAALQGYGVAVGEAFYRRDELLGLFSDAEESGKDAESDLRRGKPTSLIEEALAAGGDPERAVILAHWGDPHATATHLEAVRAAVRASGAYDASVAIVGAQVARAVSCLEQAGLATGEAGTLLVTLARSLLMDGSR